MLSRVWSETAGDVMPLVWPSSQASTELVPHSVSASEQESATLRAHLVGLKDSMEQQVRESFEAGRAEGENHVRHQFEDEVRRTVENLASGISETIAFRHDLFRQAESDIVRLAIEIARRILHRELSLDQAAVEGLVSAALDKLRSQELYRVRVHPDQEQLVRDCLQQHGLSSEIEVIRDPLQLPGGIVFDTSRGSLDASLETQLREIERELTASMEDEP